MAMYDWDTMDWEQTSVSRFEGFSETGTILEGVVHDYSPDTGAVDSQQNVCGYIRIKDRFNDDEIVQANMVNIVLKNAIASSAPRKGDAIRIIFTGEGEAKQGQSAPKYYDVFMVRDPSVGGISDEAFSNRFKNSLEGQKMRLGDEIVYGTLCHVSQKEDVKEALTDIFLDRKKMPKRSLKSYSI